MSDPTPMTKERLAEAITDQVVCETSHRHHEALCFTRRHIRPLINEVRRLQAEVERMHGLTDDLAEDVRHALQTGGHVRPR